MKISCKDQIQLQYPMLCNLEMCNALFWVSKKCFWGQSTIVEHYEEYCITKPKPKWITIPTLGYFVKHHVLIHFGLWFYKNIFMNRRMEWSYITLFKYPENALGLITYILTINKVLHNCTKNLEGNQYLNWGLL
jgi:hypothetical protein